MDVLPHHTTPMLCITSRPLAGRSKLERCAMIAIASRFESRQPRQEVGTAAKRALSLSSGRWETVDATALLVFDNCVN